MASSSPSNQAFMAFSRSSFGVETSFMIGR